MWVYGSSWCNESGCVVRRAVRYQRADKKAVPIYHKSHFADDSGNFLLSFYQVVFKLRCAKTQKCENCQQKENPSPQQIRRFPVSPSGEGPSNSLAPPPFIPLPQIDCQHILRNFYDIHDAAEKWQRHPRRFRGAEYNISPATEKLAIGGFREEAIDLRHSSETCLLDCSILNEAFFFPSGDR